MKIYTKTGDKGETSLIGGTRVLKSSVRIEAYGTIDELNSWLGLIRDQQIHAKQIAIILGVQERLFAIGAYLASDPNASRMKIPEIHSEDIEVLENAIDQCDNDLSPLKNFILPGGNTIVSYIHIARCVCRRAERRIVELQTIEVVDNKMVEYINRLSDYLFVLARYVSKAQNCQEIPWQPRI